MLLTALLTAGTAGAADRFVGRGGVDGGNDCAVSTTPCRSISYAVGQAAEGDTIKVARGSYRDFVLITGTTTLTLSGGWAKDFTSRDARNTPTIVRPPRRTGQPAIAIWSLTSATHERVDATVDGFVFKGAKSGVASVSAFPGDSVTAAFVGTTFTRSRGSDGGGVVNLRGGGSLLNVIFTDSKVLRNRAHSGYATSAGVDVRAGDGGPTNVTMTNCLLAENIARPPGPAEGGALRVYVNGSLGSGVNVSVDLTNTTIFGNRAHVGGGIYLGNNSGDIPLTLTLKNVIVWGNTAAPGEGGDLYSAETMASAVVNADHSDIGDVELEPGATLNDQGGNLNVAPGFGVDFHLTPGSPLVDAGTNAGAPTTDFDGDPRPVDGDGDTVATTDIGADELP
jgi:hypothetical protein